MLKGLCKVAAGSVLSLVVVAPVYALDPEVNVSGTFGLSLSYFGNDNNQAHFSDTELENNASNFRIMATAREIGIRAFMHYERGASNDQQGVEDVREFFGGFAGKYGTLTYGRKSTDYKLAGERLDPFYNTSVAGFNGISAGNIGLDNLPSAEGASYGLSNFTNGFTSNTISYRTSPLWGLTGNIAAYINDNDTSTHDDGDYALGIGYVNTAWLGLDAGVQVLSVNGNVVTNAPPGDSMAYRIHGTIGRKLWALGASFELFDVEIEREQRKHAFLSATYQLLQNLRLAAAYGHVADTGSAPNAPTTANFDGHGLTVGAFYDLTKNLSLYGAARYVNLEDADDNETVTAATGVKFVFDVAL